MSIPQKTRTPTATSVAAEQVSVEFARRGKMPSVALDAIDLTVNAGQVTWARTARVRPHWSTSSPGYCAPPVVGYRYSA